MDTKFSPEDLAFRDEVRSFLDEHWTEELKDSFKVDRKQPLINWQKKLEAKNWITPDWPAEFGGTDWSITQKFIFDTERAAAGAPDVLPFGIKMVAPVIYTFGTQAQKERFLPRIRASQDWWCQGYSEPGSGSDLASLKTKAELDGDEYVVTGTKVWTTYAQHADWIFCLTRTDSTGKKQAGITFLLIDMKTPGIQVNKIETIDNKHTLNEVVFDNVRVPVENRIGEENKGWTYAKALLAHERTGIAGVPESKRKLEDLRKFAGEEINGGKKLIEDPMFRLRLSNIEVELMALEFTALRVIASTADGKGPGVESSLLKIKGTEIQQALQQLLLDVSAYYSGALQGELSDETLGHDFGDRARAEYMYGRASTIYGGSNEVQKNITAKYVLGLG